MVPNGGEAPKRADVVGWSSLIANAIAPGDRNSYIRGHWKAISKSAWDIGEPAESVRTARVAPRGRNRAGLHKAVIDTFGTAVMEATRASGPERCPELIIFHLCRFEPETHADEW